MAGVLSRPRWRLTRGAMPSIRPRIAPTAQTRRASYQWIAPLALATYTIFLTWSSGKLSIIITPPFNSTIGEAPGTAVVAVASGWDQGNQTMTHRAPRNALVDTGSYGLYFACKKFVGWALEHVAHSVLSPGLSRIGVDREAGTSTTNVL
ncbi:hypothetical protein B0H19DRAFT_1071261 [Mycena capillaripes]|nr:hypothetical protein B0H19DRAFT_1071261 [Mycena capillaripes]